MSAPIVVLIPHGLGKVEASRRLSRSELAACCLAKPKIKSELDQMDVLSHKHSTVWDGKGLLFDFNLQAMGASL